mmetsp:Transcript_20620/g.31469  ORF Transcript_20620/g.31469 Transcript_20620/m.31469 type:complete len:116 (+) Transcript_20620:735-1082(+)
MALYTSSGDSFDSGGGGGNCSCCWFCFGGDEGSPVVFMESADMETERVGGLSELQLNVSLVPKDDDDDTVLKDFLGNAVIRNLSRILEMSVSLKILFLKDPLRLSLGAGDGGEVA